MRTFSLEDEEAFRAFLASTPRAVVLWRGEDCEYSEAFEPDFPKLDGRGWTLAIRWVEHGAEGPVGDRHRLDLTPTLVAYRHEAEVARLPAVEGEGITLAGAQRWVAGLER